MFCGTVYKGPLCLTGGKKSKTVFIVKEGARKRISLELKIVLKREVYRNRRKLYDVI